jgi:2-polyprenyl-6-methoxyphenol hydroxylase-like FAD-dependent oxidoreductase
MTSDAEDVLVVGAGPTGLTLAACLAVHGVRARVVDRSLDRARESRALAIQPRSLEALAGLGIADQLMAAGNPALRLSLHARGRTVSAPMFDLGLDDTAYPHLLFLSQAETERTLNARVVAAGVRVERGVELVALSAMPDGVVATLRHGSGRTEVVRTRYVVGCDGAHSSVRRLAGIAFEGGSYPQTFVLADVDADGVTPDAVHVYLSGHGMLFLFPLGAPAGWRLLVMRPPGDTTPPDAAVPLDEVQALADAYTGASVRLRDPVWMTNFRLHHRAAVRYRAGPVFLAGDAAHIHSPAGAQGMNTGIQDAHNLAWKLAETLAGTADPALLDTYDPERSPVGRAVLRFTDRAFTVATSTNPVVRFGRTRLAPAALALALRYRTGRAYAFRTLAQLNVTYRNSPLSTAGPRAPRGGPRPGDRLPDAEIVHDGRPTTLHQVTAEPGWHLLLCGPAEAWPIAQINHLRTHHARVLSVHQLTTEDTPSALYDRQETAAHRLGTTHQRIAQYLIRPDGHVAFKAGGPHLDQLVGYLRRWLAIPPA